MKYHIEIQILNGAPERMADNQPQSFEVECEVGYTIDPGQKEILNPSDKCQPGYPAQVEDITLESAFILYGSTSYRIGEDSRWWDILQEKITDNESLQDEIMEYESDMAEDGGW